MKRVVGWLGAVVVAGVLLGVGGCASDAEVIDGGATASGVAGQPKNVDSKADASAVAVFLDFEYDGSFTAASCWNAEQQVENQILYTIGQLNGDNSVGRIDRLDVTQLTKTEVEGGCQIGYHARLPVAWGKKNKVPTSYTFKLPADMRTAALDRFVEKYEHGCLEWGAHDVTAGIFWYYYRPANSGCHLDAEDVVESKAAVLASPIQTTGKYPEYHEVWKDGTFDVVAIFGKYEDGATSGDAGIKAYNKFLGQMRDELGAFSLMSEPAEIPKNPGVKVPRVMLEASLDGGRKVRVFAFLIDSVGTASGEFWDQYETLTPTADFIVYNGHAGLGANIRKLARRGVWAEGQYSIVFMNGCDTYAYVDSALSDAHAQVNADDPEGTKYLDIVANAMPSMFNAMSGATTALVTALVDYEHPRTYEQIFENIDDREVVLVSGEQDNVYVPGYEPGGATDPDTTWDGDTWSGNLAKDERFEVTTPELPAGRYELAMDGTGDADLYVRLGELPSIDLYDCRPYLNGTAEVCEVLVQTPAVIGIMVVGWDATSDFTVTATRVE